MGDVHLQKKGACSEFDPNSTATGRQPGSDRARWLSPLAAILDGTQGAAERRRHTSTLSSRAGSTGNCWSAPS